MGFYGRAPRAPSPARVRAKVFAVGRRVFVSCSGDGPTRVQLTDDAGKIALTSLGDGAEVAILAWRPGSASGARYQVRATATGNEGWLAVGNLRGTEVAVAPSAPTPPVPSAAPLRMDEFADSDRRFGRRSR